MLSALAHGAEPGATVTLRERVMVGQVAPTLGDLAEIAGGDARLKADLAALPVGPAPRAGYRDRRLRAQLAKLVDARLPAARRRVVWQGSDSVEIETAAQRFSGRAVSEAAQAFLRRELASPGGRVEVAEASPTADLDLPPGTVSLSARLAPAAAIRSRQTVWVDLAVDGRFVRSQTVALRLAVHRPVWRAKVALARGAALDCAQLEQAEADVAALAAEPFGPDCAEGRRLRQTVAAGDVLLANRVEAAPAVAQGQNVILQLAAGAVRLETPAVALADAALGQTVRVRPARGDDAVAARVIAAGRVAAEGEGKW